MSPLVAASSRSTASPKTRRSSYGSRDSRRRSDAEAHAGRLPAARRRLKVALDHAIYDYNNVYGDDAEDDNSKSSGKTMEQLPRWQLLRAAPLSPAAAAAASTTVSAVPVSAAVPAVSRPAAARSRLPGGLHRLEVGRCGDAAAAEGGAGAAQRERR